MHHREKPVATDTIDYYTLEIDDGSTCDHLFIGKKSLISDVYGMKKYKQFSNVLDDNRNVRRKMSRLISDHYQYEIRNYAQSIIWDLFIDDRKREPHYQYEKISELHYQKIKRLTNNIPECKVHPNYTCLISLMHV